MIILNIKLLLLINRHKKYMERVINEILDKKDFGSAVESI